MQLYIGNKNYSSWSMRPWVLLREFNIPFDEVMLRFDGFDAQLEAFKQAVTQLVAQWAKCPCWWMATWWCGTHSPLPKPWPSKPPRTWPCGRADGARPVPGRAACAPRCTRGFGALRIARARKNIEARLARGGRQRLLAEQAGRAPPTWPASTGHVERAP